MSGGSRYDPEWTTGFNDRLGAKEWERFEAAAADGIGLHLHERLLRELGAGAGLAEDSPEWRELLRLEAEACRSRGALEAGTHLLLAARKPAG